MIFLILCRMSKTFDCALDTLSIILGDSWSYLNLLFFHAVVLFSFNLQVLASVLWYFCRKEDPFQGPEVGSCLTLRNELSEEIHVLTKQDILWGRCAQEESSRVREPRRTTLPRGSQARVLWLWDSFLGCL